MLTAFCDQKTSDRANFEHVFIVIFVCTVYFYSVSTDKFIFVILFTIKIQKTIVNKGATVKQRGTTLIHDRIFIVSYV